MGSKISYSKNIANCPAALRISGPTILQVFLIAKYMRIEITDAISNRAIEGSVKT
jgi:hypothetical protein